MREYWSAVLRNDTAVPDDRPLPELLNELLDGLASPDPSLRDDIVYPVLVRWVLRGECDPHAVWLGDRVTGMLRHDEIQARTFATLILGAIIERDTAAPIVDMKDAHRWFEEFAQWWTSETDLRGKDPELGWLHAAAHGADTLSAYGASRHLTAVGLRDLLSVAARRMTADTDQLWGAQEDDRIALACTVILSRDELSESDATDWLTDIADSLTSRATPGSIPAWAQNTFHTLKSLYVHVDRGATADGTTLTPPHRNILRDRITAALRIGWPPLAE